MRNRALPGILACVAVSAFVALWGAFSPLSAQDVPLATNTPRILATNTPRPPTSIPVTPDAPIDNYALRLWSEPGLVELLAQQSRSLREGDLEGELSIQLLQFELGRRFPGAPRNADDRAQLLSAMLAAPRGSIDMRDVARRHLEDVFSTLTPSLAFAGSYERDGWLFEVMPANADNGAAADAVVHSLFPASPVNADAIRYEDYVFVSSPTTGVYRVLDADFPVAPLGNAQSLSSPFIGDLTADGTDDIVLLVNTGDLNQRLYIFGWRGDAITDLVLPGAPAFVSDVQDLQPGSQAFTGHITRLESPRWQCLSEQTVPWRFALNYFRPASDPGGFADQRTLACALYRAEPFFSTPPQESISTIENLLSALSDDPAAPRAQLALAVLYALDDQPEVASGLAAAISGPDVTRQAEALIAAIAADMTPAQICAAVVRAAETAEAAFCDVDQVLTRLLTEEPLLRDMPISDQLAAMGIHVRDQVTIRQVGRFDRQAVSFDLAGMRWWAFAPLNAETYTAERIEPPAGYEETSRSALVLKLPDAAVDALFRDDLSGALLALDNALRDQPGVVTAPDFAFMQALLHDITGQRALARSEYYALWRDFPASLWGKLAANHLERR
ncbi:MAG: hypothetical protein IT320_13720 [Anaerolineae bacterium]|nr:hypothetical protein [Anaerolineae bacterium]